MRKPHILIIEDDENFSKMMVECLSHKYKIQTADSVPAAQLLIMKYKFDLVVTDYALCGHTGLDVLAVLNKIQPRPPVIIMTGMATKEMVIECLKSGVQDFVEKPLTSIELSEAIDTCLATRGSSKKRNIEISPGNSLMLDRQRAVVGNEIISLTATESELLRFLVERKGQVVSHDEFVSQIWSGKTVAENVIHTHFSNIKKKIPALGKIVKTIRSKGVIWED